ncbi:RHS repeat-associated core domain-containing protein [Anoxybacillus rupiensis]|uniref:RHS repeat-associated core domain-containing protein n=3 Tax=Anoxybacteroides rupiense TaxID=311460 RepID=A0ABT5W663_9BACL|nr:RHS repeat-associated core domain-containing protein [Anoxybacillus rupiensis]QHC03418.1 hypothetical protein GRQ40_05210 [Anoxybacillus sp. PDR2]
MLSVSENAAVAGQPIGYAGYYYDRETKLYYLQARYYDPETARFISRDPDPGDKDDPITQNAYTYANDNPVMLVDPDGKFAISIDRIKYALKYGLKGWLASYFDWATADKIVAGSVAIADKIYKIATEIAKGYKAGKAINTVFREALNKILIGRGYKNQILNIVKKQARKIGTKVVLRRITTLSFWWTDLALFTGYTIVGYNKYRK